MVNKVPDSRKRCFNQIDPNLSGRFVLYWMNAFRRFQDNFALQYAVEWSNSIGKQLIILEGLACDYPWANQRFHSFILDGMKANLEQAATRKVDYFPLIEKSSGQELEAVQDLAPEATVIITDDFPSSYHQNRLHAVAHRIDCRFEAVDSNGLLPLRSVPKIYHRAFSFRQFLKKELTSHLTDFPLEQPLDHLKPELLGGIKISIFSNSDFDLELSNFELPIDNSVLPVKQFPGGSERAVERLDQFLKYRLDGYSTLRNQPERDSTSGLSPYLQSGHISPHTIFRNITACEAWSPEKICGDKQGNSWFGLSENAEAFLDQLITWRELGYNMAWQDPGYSSYESLPQWALKTLQDHAKDPREEVYSMEQFENAETHDALWNAAQNQLREEGIIHNYLRMVWGKKILEWSQDPQEALNIMIHLNNKYALDGRNPNSYSGIFWVLGRYDRPWGPERPIFGKIRYMSTANTARKFKIKSYIHKYSQSQLSFSGD